MWALLEWSAAFPPRLHDTSDLSGYLHLGRHCCVKDCPPHSRTTGMHLQSRSAGQVGLRPLKPTYLGVGYPPHNKGQQLLLGLLGVDGVEFLCRVRACDQ